MATHNAAKHNTVKLGGSALRQMKDEVRQLIRGACPENQILTDIDRINILDESVFRQYANTNRPFFMAGGAKDWPLTRDGLSTFIRDFCDNPIEVRYGNYSRGNSPFTTRTTTIGDFAATFDADHNERPEYAGFQVANDALMARVLYPPWLDTDHTRHPFHYWFGPGGTYTALHSDTCDKLVYQCDGRKIWYLIAPQHRDYLGIDPDFGRGYDTSPFDPRDADVLAKANADGVPVIQFEIGPGDLFFLPGGWYHAITALTPSLSFEYKSDPVPKCIEDPALRQDYLSQYGQLMEQARAAKAP